MAKKSPENSADDREWSEVRRRYGTSFRISPKAHKLAKIVAAWKNVSISGLVNELTIRELEPLVSDYSKQFLDGDIKEREV